MELVKINKEQNGITVISLNRPEKRNALNIDLMSQLCEAITETEMDPKQRVIILKGEGPVFCTGLDLAEAKKIENAELSANALAKMFKMVKQCSLATIAAVHGAAFAGGGGIVAACDFAIAEENSQFGFPETRRGLVAAQVAVLLSTQLTQRHLKELLIFGITIGAHRAHQIGLINRIATKEGVMNDALYYASQIMLGAPKATAKTKELIETLDPTSFSDNINYALKRHHEARTSQEAQEGIDAFFEKRKPKWLE